MFKKEEAAPNKNIILKKLDRASWNDFPVDTKVHGINGGYYVRVLTGWKWYGSGETVPRPSADWSRIELPFSEEDVAQSKKEVFGDVMYDGLENCKHESDGRMSGDGCKHCGGWFCL
jgi:hypothetical protein